MDERKRNYEYDNYGFFNPIHYLKLWEQPRYRGKKRAGFTTNKRQGTSKSKRKMTERSQKVNRH